MVCTGRSEQARAPLQRETRRAGASPRARRSSERPGYAEAGPATAQKVEPALCFIKNRPPDLHSQKGGVISEQVFVLLGSNRAGFWVPARFTTRSQG